MADDNEPILNLPPFPELRWNGYSWRSQFVLNSWRGFQSRLGPYCDFSSDEPSDGTMVLDVESPTEDSQEPPSPETARAFQYLLDHEQAVHDAVLQAIFEYYPTVRNDWVYADGTSPSFPEITQPMELKTLLGLCNVHLLRVAKDGIGYVGFEFGWVWEEEHGLGIMVHRERIVSVGQADDSFLWWIAARDAGHIE